MNPATITPKYPSTLTSENAEIIIAIRATPVARQSLKLSFITAIIGEELIFLPRVLLNNPNQSFAKMLTIRIIKETQLNFTGTGFMILSTELLKSSIPISKTTKETARAEMYSTLP